MTTTTFAPRPEHDAYATLRGDAPRAFLSSLGTAIPELCWPQHEIAEQLARLWNLDVAEQSRWRRIIAGSGIDQRFGVMPLEEVIHQTTAQRMAAYEHFAPPLAEAAARRAIERAGIDARDITDVVVVSCTGMSAPGLDVALIERLGLGARTRRTTIGFMGCFGAINGLRIAGGLCAADPHATALVVCAELCSLHVRDDRDPQNQVACALFGDGAAAAIVCGERETVGGRRRVTTSLGECDGQSDFAYIGLIGQGESLLMPEGRDWMTWRITDAGFAMTLMREVPVALRDSLAGFVGTKRRHGDHVRSETIIVHPGGPGVLDAVDAALELRGGHGLERSRTVLRRHGNMSSATVIFVLEEALKHSELAPFRLLAFGPGLTIESLVIHPTPSRLA